MRSIANFLLTKLGSRLDSAQSNIVEPTLHQEGSPFTNEVKKAFLILSNQHWLRSGHSSREYPFNLTVVTATLIWALLVDALCWNLLVGKPLHASRASWFTCSPVLPVSCPSCFCVPRALRFLGVMCPTYSHAFHAWQLQFVTIFCNFNWRNIITVVFCNLH